MIKFKAKYFLIYLIFAILFMVYSACNGIFPTQTKSNLPADHNSTFGGYFHKSIKRGGEASDCEQCHGHDLRGQVYNNNGTLIVTQSCYQCHNNLWEGRNGGNDGNQ
jgi:hypothetical protein